MIGFALFISIGLSAIDQQRLEEQAVKHNQSQVQQTEEMVTSSLHSFEKAHYLFEEETASKMQENTYRLLDKYKDNPHFDEWDFEQLEQQLGMDIYILDTENVITHSSFPDDIGLDFEACCEKLASVLNERREAGHFFHDGMDIEQETGEVKKYSYMATPDKQYMIELGYSVEESQIFEEFNFFRVMENLADQYDSIYDIHVLNIGGYSLGEPVDEARLSPERREAFEKTYATKQPSEVEEEWKGEPAIYRYTPYESKVDNGTTKNKVLEIVYNNNELQSVLEENRNNFYMTLVIVLTVATALALLISHWIAKPMHMAFHDSLTGLKNRAAFNDFLRSQLRQKSQETALIMVDLDNFKAVNDTLGHDRGDVLLKQIAFHLSSTIRKGDTPFRLGGDEFMIIMPHTNREEAESAAARVISDIQHSIETDHSLSMLNVTASAGIAIAPEHGKDPDVLFKKADSALYASKEKGKNQYHVYEEDGYEEDETG
ncbi:diguanylate cyclase (GGDEF) domain-containing protein [Alteribacillus iranensis]|uniref:Diguanylate cyclase (GGDEF) domain-containing protein n=2 Tax=Alteribacillus iranensis TaxID=930128 RepID=A0A1I2BQK5_9BACI|nr:diguanylate cyclase (GGDEF) domain-containing protein [Alteribacillus iranensis]